MTVLSFLKNRWTHLYLTQWPQLYPVGIFKKTMNRNEANAVQGHIFQQITRVAQASHIYGGWIKNLVLPTVSP